MEEEELAVVESITPHRGQVALISLRRALVCSSRLSATRSALAQQAQSSPMMRAEDLLGAVGLAVVSHPSPEKTKRR